MRPQAKRGRPDSEIRCSLSHRISSRQAHTSYLAGLGTRTDQKVGRDAIERLAVLKKDYDRLEAEADTLLDS